MIIEMSNYRIKFGTTIQNSNPSVRCRRFPITMDDRVFGEVHVLQDPQQPNTALLRVFGADSEILLTVKPKLEILFSAPFDITDFDMIDPNIVAVWCVERIIIDMTRSFPEATIHGDGDRGDLQTRCNTLLPAMKHIYISLIKKHNLTPTEQMQQFLDGQDIIQMP